MSTSSTRSDIYSVAGAVIFTVLYVPLSAFFIRKAFTYPTRPQTYVVHYMISLFCLVQVAVFAIRAVLTGSKTAGFGEAFANFAWVDEMLSRFASLILLHPSYVLLLDRVALLSNSPPLAVDRPVLKLIQDRWFFFLAFFIGMVLRSAVMLLVLAVLQGLHADIFSKSAISRRSQYYTQGKDTLGIRYGDHILLIISVLLLIREAYSVSTGPRSTANLQDNEPLWYPLIVVPEILVVILFTTPGFVPRRDKLPDNGNQDGQASKS